MPKTQRRAVGIKWVSRAKLRSILNSRAQRLLGMSGDEFRKRYTSGTLKRRSLEGKAGTVELATICSFTKETRGRKDRKRSG
jgi:hypothetical protein